MITLTLWFWTNDLAEQKGRILPKHARAAGMVGIDRNAAHGITPGKTKPFHSLLDLGAVIEKELIEHGVTLHAPKRMRKYFTSD